MNEIEGILIKIIEPRLNKQGGNLEEKGKAIEYFQCVEPETSLEDIKGQINGIKELIKPDTTQKQRQKKKKNGKLALSPLHEAGITGAGYNNAFNRQDETSLIWNAERAATLQTSAVLRKSLLSSLGLTFVYTNEYNKAVIPRSFESFDWDDGNREKCQKHGVLVKEIEEALKSDAMMILPDVKHSDAEDRFIATGQAENGRYLFVAFTLRETNRIRPVSARYMHEKEVKKYEKARAKIKNGQSGRKFS